MVDLYVDLSDKLSLNQREGFRDLFSAPTAETGFEVAADPSNPRVAIIRTSDRIAFKGCRRRWGWSSHLRHNLGPRVGIGPLWFGTGIHFALEDFHGYNRFGHPKTAFEAFVAASTRHNKAKLPEDWEELLELGRGMMDYYIIWLQQRPLALWKTLWIDGVPQVEVNFRFRIPGDWSHFGYDEVYYSGTIDRVCVDPDNMLWPLDYKSAKAIEIMHFMTDPQINAYMWAIPYLYDPEKYNVGGFLYAQFKKAIPNPGRILQNGQVSTAQNQGTTWYMYRQTLIDVYGAVERSADGHQQYLKQLLMFEDENKDAFIQFDKVQRNPRQGQSEGLKILMEVEDMLNPNLPLYPNPTRFCQNTMRPEFSCPFLSPCVSMDDGGDWVHELEMTTEFREAKYDSWRAKLIWPGQASTPIEDTTRNWLDV